MPRGFRHEMRAAYLGYGRKYVQVNCPMFRRPVADPPSGWAIPSIEAMTLGVIFFILHSGGFPVRGLGGGGIQEGPRTRELRTTAILPAWDGAAQLWPQGVRDGRSPKRLVSVSISGGEGKPAKKAEEVGEELKSTEGPVATLFIQDLKLYRFPQLQEVASWDSLTWLCITKCRLMELSPAIGQLRALKARLVSCLVSPFWTSDALRGQKLNLSYNFLFTFPEELGQLSELEKLEAYGNFMECIPDSFGELKKLNHVGLLALVLSSQDR